jgi:TonB family protein
MIAQTFSSDSLVNIIYDNKLFEQDQGVQLIKQEKFEEANSYLNTILEKDDLNKDAYFKRGVVNWELNDTLAACRDWSSVLAMGDTASFLLLESRCNATMIIEDDKIPSTEYKKMFASELSQKPGSVKTTAKTVVEVMPEFPGGDIALMKYLSSNLHYPDQAKIHNVQGRVYVNFIISSRGKVLFPYVVRGIGSGCDQEAIRIIKNMPLWKPGKQNGKAVPVRFNVPVKFALK